MVIFIIILNYYEFIYFVRLFWIFFLFCELICIYSNGKSDDYLYIFIEFGW